MGSKVDGFVASVERIRFDDSLFAIANGIVEAMLGLKDDNPGDMFEAADELLDLDRLKALIKAASEAINEQLDMRNDQLYSEMLEKEMQNFSRMGKTFYLTKDTYVQARKDLGGTSNPDLVEWLEDNGRGEIAKRNVHAGSLRSAVNEWLEQNPVEAVVDGSELDGKQLLEHLGVDDAMYAHRVSERERLMELVVLTENPRVGVRKAAK